MAIALWRIAADTPHYGSDELSGKGAAATGGRWNREGTPCIYASQSIALACLESIVHLGGPHPLPLNRYLVRIDVPDKAWRKRTMFDEAAHIGWDASPAALVSLNWGSAWIEGRSTVIAQVPSIVVAEESNFLLNPRHPDANPLAATKLRRWNYDARLGVPPYTTPAHGFAPRP